MKKLNKEHSFIVGIVVVGFLLIGISLMYVKSSKNMINDNRLSISLPSKYKTETYNGENYIYVPINEDLSKFNAKVYFDKDTVLDSDVIVDYFRLLDTLIPGERIEVFTFDEHQFTLHIIVE